MKIARQSFNPVFCAIPLFAFIAAFNGSAGAKGNHKGGRNEEHHATDAILRWREAPFEIITHGFKTFKTTKFANVFATRKNCVVKIAPELEGLTGIRLATINDSIASAELNIKFTHPVKLLVGIFSDSALPAKTNLTSVDLLKGKLQSTAVLQNGVTITGLPAVDVYAVDYPKGIHSINFSKSFKGLYTILGVVESKQRITPRKVAFPDGRLWEPFIVDGFYDDAPLFKVVSGPDAPVVDEGMPGTEGIQGGFEGGAVVKVNDTYHMFPTERAGEQGVRLPRPRENKDRSLDQQRCQSLDKNCNHLPG